MPIRDRIKQIRHLRNVSTFGVEKLYIIGSGNIVKADRMKSWEDFLGSKAPGQESHE